MKVQMSAPAMVRGFLRLGGGRWVEAVCPKTAAAAIRKIATTRMAPLLEVAAIIYIYVRVVYFVACIEWLSFWRCAPVSFRLRAASID